MDRLENIVVDKEKGICTLEFKDLEIEIVTHVYPATRYEPEDYDTITGEEDYDYEVDIDEIYEFLYDYLPIDVENFSEEEINKYMDEHLDELLKENLTAIENHYIDDANEAAEEYYQNEYDNYEPDYNDYEDRYDNYYFN